MSIGLVALALGFGGCASAFDGEVVDQELPPDEAADEVRVASWERFVGRWERNEGTTGSFVSLDFTRVATTGGHEYRAMREVSCVRAPCEPVPEQGAYRSTSSYLYLTSNRVTQRYSYTLRNDSLTLRRGSTVVARLHRVAVGAAEGETCGGIAAIRCREGLSCQPSGTHPDASGTCVAAVGAAEGETCGGIAAIRCREGLTCRVSGTHPDASGTCVR